MLTLATQPLSPLLSLSEGDLLGTRYRIESLIRSRPAGVWFAATDLTCGRRVEAHVLVVSSSPGSPPTAREDEARVSFLTGARRAKALVGPHIARVLDAGVTFEGHPWIVRELVATEPLEEHLKTSGALGVAEAVDIALAVADAIAEAHANGIIHGSLGPHCVHAAYSASGLVDVKVTGTGTSSVENALSLGATGKVESVLRSPEQITSGARVDGRADVWAIGALLHTMLAGAPPFTADTPSGASLSVVLDEPPSLAGVPDELGEIVDRALSKNPDVRQRTVIDFADAIVRYASNPDIEQDRIDRRRPQLRSRPLVVALGHSDPTLDIDKKAYLALSREQQVVRPAEPELVDVSPSVRDLVAEANKSPSSPPAPQPSPQSLLPTRRAIGPSLAPASQSFPRRRAFRIMGLATAAASVALLVLIGTEGARLSRSRPAAPALEAPNVAAAPPAMPEPPSTIVVAPQPSPQLDPAPPPSAAPASITPAPRHLGPAKRTRQNVPAVHQAPASPRASASPPSEPSASKPSTSGSGDDLRRFLDDRR